MPRPPQQLGRPQLAVFSTADPDQVTGRNAARKERRVVKADHTRTDRDRPQALAARRRPPVAVPWQLEHHLHEAVTGWAARTGLIHGTSMPGLHRCCEPGAQIARSCVPCRSTSELRLAH